MQLSRASVVIASDHRERGNPAVVVLKSCEIALASPRNDTGDCLSNNGSGTNVRRGWIHYTNNVDW